MNEFNKMDLLIGSIGELSNTCFIFPDTTLEKHYLKIKKGETKCFDSPVHMKCSNIENIHLKKYNLLDFPHSYKK